MTAGAGAGPVPYPGQVVRKAEQLTDPTRQGRGRGTGASAGRRQGQAPLGNITRGTTAPNRMRRVDRWLADVHGALLRGAERPLAVDLGFGAEPVTAVEMFDRLHAVRPGWELVGLEIDPERVRRAQQDPSAQREGLSWAQGGFELPVDRAPALVRAFNVLRQYREEDVPEIWAMMQGRLAPGGVLVEGTCSETGRRACWVDLAPDRVRSLTLAVRFGEVQLPSEVAERLPKALIHHNVPGTPIHRFLAALDAAWLSAAPLAVYGHRQRWIAMSRQVRAEGWPVLGGVRQWRRGEISVGWEAVQPEG